MVVGKAVARLHIKGEPDAFIEKLLTPEEVGMSRDSLSELVGDGDARVTASLELKDSDYGTGFGAHVSVSLSVDQTEEMVEAGFGLALDYAGEFVSEAFDHAHRLRNEKDKTAKAKKGRK